LKDELKWKLGLRTTSFKDVSNVGLKHLVLDKNSFGNQTALAIANLLKNDEYMKSISLKKNYIEEEGV
jgi:Ran GTPase-activating protein (RanGAP) involved in mRNA processing and transport